MSHHIDFRSLGLTKRWNGQWEYPEVVWKVIVGKRPYLINRQPCTTHISLMIARGFDITCELRQRMEGIPREKLAPRWQDISDDDLVTPWAFIQAQLRERSHEHP